MDEYTDQPKLAEEYRRWERARRKAETTLRRWGLEVGEEPCVYHALVRRYFQNPEWRGGHRVDRE